MISDVAVLAQCVPGVELAGRDEDGSYRGWITFQTGPKSIRFEGVVTFSLDDNDHHGTLEATGADRRQASRARAALEFTLSDHNDGLQLWLDANVTFVGALAEFAESGGVYVGEQLIDGFAASMQRRLAERAAAERNEGGEKVEVMGPESGATRPALAEGPPAAPIRVKLWLLVWRSLRSRFRTRKSESASTTKRE